MVCGGGCEGCLGSTYTAHEDKAHATLSKLHTKLEGFRGDTRSMLEPFSSSLWESMKEAKLTGLLSKFTTFLSEASIAGDEEAFTTTQRWLSHEKS